MHDQSVQSQPPPDARHEPLDINTRPLKIAVVIFVLAMLVIHLGLLLLFRLYAHSATHPDRNLVTSQVRDEASPTVPEPRIQGVPAFHGNVPRLDMEQLRHDADQRLHSYGKSDEPGFVHIPIDRAMQILAEKGIKPTTQQSK
jgi:hypothetical protein